jgi:hypothetical protein
MYGTLSDSTMSKIPSYNEPVTTLGLVFILIGAILVFLPTIARNLPSLERLPWFILWVYQSDNFYFATSPLLIALSLLSLLYNIMIKGR